MELPQYTNRESKEFATIMSNWTYLAIHLVEIYDEDQLLQMIRFELDHKQRAIIIERVKQRYNKIRNRREWNELEAYAEKSKC